MELGLSACFREHTASPLTVKPKGPATDRAIGAVVFGSDQGLVGQFNEVVADFAVNALAAWPGRVRVWAVGDRVHARLADAGLPLAGLFTVPNSVKAITPLVGQILIETETRHSPSAPLRAGQGEVAELHLFYNRPATGAVYAPVSQQLLPLDERWRRTLAERPWPTRSVPEVMGGGTADPAGADPRIPVRVALPGMRRIPREREREPPGGHATRRHRTSTTCWRT